jgi:hypothetical protein
MIALRKTLLVLITILTLSGTALAAISYTLSTIPNPSSIYTGDSTTVLFSIRNDNSLYGGLCAVRLDTALWSSEYAVNAGATLTLSMSVSAPAWGSGSGSEIHTVYSYCYSTADSTKIYQSTAFTLTYTENPNYIAQKEAQAAKDSAQNAITSAKKVIDSASASKAEAQNAINDAKNIGADIGSAQTFLDTTSSKLDSAYNKYNEANSYFTNLKWSDAKSSANQAESYANEALTNAGNAKSIAIQAKEKYAAEGGDTKLKLDSAQTTYNNVVDTIDKTNESLKLASSIGVETSEFSNDLEKVTSTLVDAKAELNKAKTRYETKELSESRTYSENSLAITEKDITILKETQNKMALAAIDKLTTNYSSANSNYDVAAKTLEESKAKITGDVYVTKKEKLDTAKKSLDNASNLMTQAKSYADTEKYSDAVISLKGAFIELGKAESLLEEIKPASTIPSFEVIYALAGLSVAYLVILRRKNIF